MGLFRYLPVENPDSLVDIELPSPVPSGRDILVRVHAVSVNPVDTKIRAPRSNVEKEPRVLGWDASGVVEAVGTGSVLFKPGDEVFYAGSVVRPGCNSELHLVDERIVAKKPKTLSYAEAAALPLTAITAWEALFDRMHIPRDGSAKGRSILIVGGAGGVGSIAIQIAKQVAKLTVIATASREESRAWCLKNGADLVVNHSADLSSQIQAAGHQNVDYVFCLNNIQAHFPALVDLVAPQGLICSIVGSNVALDVGRLFQKSAGLVWELMFTRSQFQTPDMEEQHRLLESISGLVDSGNIVTTLTRTLRPINAANLREAHRLIEDGHTTGKIVLEGF